MLLFDRCAPAGQIPKAVMKKIKEKKVRYKQHPLLPVM